jgi:hypothetical protein
VIVDYPRDRLRFREGVPVAAGDQELASPTRVERTPGGYWALYQVGDQVLVVHPGGAMQGPPDEVGERLRGIAGDTGRGADDRAAASAFLTLTDPATDNPGKAGAVPRSPSAETGLPPTYPLSGPRNAPGGPTGSASGASTPDAPPE